MSKKMADGVLRMGHLVGSGPDESEVVSVQFDAIGALIIWPRRGAVHEAFSRISDGHSVPRVLHYVDHEGRLTFAECRLAGSTASSLGVAVDRIRSDRIIHSGASPLTYDEVDGMSSEIDGLATWAGLTTVSQTIEPRTDPSGVRAVVIRAENPEAVKLGGRLDLNLVTVFDHNPTPTGNVYTITDILMARSGSGSLLPWREHAVVHRMLQDLVCLAYGKPCLMRLRSIKREDDQPYLSEGDHRRTWRDAYEPSFGRNEDHVKPLERRTDRPLFYLADIDSDRLVSWIDDFDHWSRPTWIAVTTMFQSGTTIEAQLLQIGVALESLGYALWLEKLQHAGTTPERTPYFPEFAGACDRFSRLRASPAVRKARRQLVASGIQRCLQRFQARRQPAA